MHAQLMQQQQYATAQLRISQRKLPQRLAAYCDVYVTVEHNRPLLAKHVLKYKRTAVFFQLQLGCNTIFIICGK